MLATELYTRDIPRIYERFASVVGDQHWRRRVLQLNDEARGNRFLTEYFHEENSIAFQLERYRKLASTHGRVPNSACNDRDLYPAASLAAQALSIIDASPTEHGKRLVRRLHGAFSSPDDMRALRLELTAATHFIRRGARVEWPEMNGGGTFDLLVETPGNLSLEIECKSISDDKGRKVHRREAMELYSRVWKVIKPLLPRLTIGLSVVVTVPERLPTRHLDRVALAERVGRQIIEGRDAVLPDGTEIRVTEFDPDRVAGIATEGRPEILRSVVDDVTATSNRNAMLAGAREGTGVIAMAVQSAADDSPLDALFNTLSDSAKRQLTGSRPGIFVAGLNGLKAEELLSIAELEADPTSAPTALRTAVSRFLSGARREHVVGVAFLSQDALSPQGHATVKTGGAAYCFPHRESPFWHADLNGLFV